MSRVYRVPFTFTWTIAGGDVDILAFRPAADKPIQLKQLRLGQTSELGDAEELGVDITIRRMGATVTNGSGGAAVTPVAAESTDTAAGFTARAGDTTVATTTGTNEIGERIGWNVRNSPFETLWPDPEDRPRARGTVEALVIRGETTVPRDMTIVGCAWVEEI